MGWCVSAQTRRGALRAPAVTLNVGRLSCSRRFAGKGYFTYGKSQRLLRRSPHVVRVLHRLASIDCYDAFKSAGLPQQNFAALRMTHSRGGRMLRKSFASAGGDPLIHRERSPFPSGEGLGWCPLHKLVRSRFAFCVAVHTVANCRFCECMSKIVVKDAKILR